MAGGTVTGGTTDRRRRRRVRPVPVRAPRREHHQRGRDARAGLRRGAGGHRAGQGRHRLLVLGLLGLPGGPGVLVRPGGGRDRGLPADHGVARGDGRRLGAVRGLGEDPHRRGRHRARLRLRQVVRRAAPAGARPPARPLPGRPALARLRRHRGAAGQARHRGRALEREGHGAGGRAQPRRGDVQPAGAAVRRGQRRGAARRALPRRPAPGPRLRAGRRRRRGRDPGLRRART